MSSTPAEQLLKKVRKLEANCVCPNCQTAAPKGIGFGNVCVKFGIFVCDLCKTSHQAVSHRVKSVSMSTWTMDEVKALEHPYGGNYLASITWLATAPAAGSKERGRQRPKQGDDILVFKQFVVDCYEKKLYMALNPPDVSAIDPPRPPSRPVSVKLSPPQQPSTKPQSVALAPEISLLDLDTPPTTSSSSSSSSSSSHLSSSFDAFSLTPLNDFGSFVSASSSSAVPHTVIVNNSNYSSSSAPIVDFADFTPFSSSSSSEAKKLLLDDDFGDFSSAVSISSPINDAAFPSHSQTAPTNSTPKKNTIDLDALYQQSPRPTSMPSPSYMPMFGQQHAVMNNPISSEMAPSTGAAGLSYTQGGYPPSAWHRSW